MPHTVKLIDLRKFPVTSGPRMGQLDTIVTYQVDNDQMAMLILAKADPTEADIKTAISKDVEDRSKLIGKTFTL